VLEQCLLDLESEHSDCHTIICGDLDSRTASKNSHDNDIDDTDPLLKGDHPSLFPRTSVDTTSNTFGDQLIELCTMFQCSLVNGCTSLAADNSFTYISKNGCSVVDYFVLSNDLISDNFVYNFHVGQRIESHHMPVVMKTKPCVADEDEPSANEGGWSERIVWDKSKVNCFKDLLVSEPITEQLAKAMSEIDENVDDALSTFTGCLLSASEGMKKRFKQGQCASRREAMWFDSECQEEKKNVRKLLQQYRTNYTTDDRVQYTEARNKYVLMMKEKKKVFARDKSNKLMSCMGDSCAFWKEVRQFIRKRKGGSDQTITKEDWYNYFKGVFNPDAEADSTQPVNSESLYDEHNLHKGEDVLHIDGDDVNDDDMLTDENDVNDGDMLTNENDDCDAYLNGDITVAEVKRAMQKLKSGKAGGIDGVLPDMLKAAEDCAVAFMTPLFNKIFKEGLYPETWCKAVICPIHKKGDKHIADNYRGVSLLCIISKCYTSVLNARLVKWMQVYEKIVESQAGFRKKYSTVDHIFTLSSIIEKSLSKRRGKLYVAFVDLRKAFDSVDRQSLFRALSEAGVSGRMLKSLMSIYKSVLSCVRAGSSRTDFFECPLGLRQGCCLSPSLFTLFINAVADNMDAQGRHGIQLMPGLLELFLLMFADDIALLSDTAQGLQNQLNCLARTCSDLKLTVNTEKTKIMVFRKGGALRRNEKWFLNGDQLEVVNSYVYLGFQFTTQMSIVRGVSHFIQKGKRATFDCIRLVNQLKELPRSVFFKIFDTQVVPILLYSSEVWGLQRLENLERVHVLAIKRYLRVPMKTPNRLVYGESGRYPLYISSTLRCIKYWLKLLRMPDSRLPKQAYNMMLTMVQNGKKCWAMKVHDCLFSNGFGYVWVNQFVPNEKQFISELKQRLIDNYGQEWWAALQDSDRYSMYRQFKTHIGPELYFECVTVRCFRDVLVKFRVGVLLLNYSAQRARIGIRGDASCVACKSVMESEEHFLLYCPEYNSLRDKYITKYIRGNYSFQFLMQCTTDEKTRDLARFIFHAYKRRQLLLQICQ